MPQELEIDQLLAAAAEYLRTRDVCYAVAGGIAASLYRDEVRATQDIDLLVETNQQAVVRQMMEHFGQQVSLVRQAQLEGGPLFAIKRKSTPVWMMAGRQPQQPNSVGLDCLLDRFPWGRDALGRAQANRVDFGVTVAPVLTVEDVIIAKLMAISYRSDRFKDLDDLQAIFRASVECDYGYLCGRLRALALTIPEALEACAPEAVRKTSRDISRHLRRRPAEY